MRGNRDHEKSNCKAGVVGGGGGVIVEMDFKDYFNLSRGGKSKP